MRSFVLFIFLLFRKLNRTLPTALGLCKKMRWKRSGVEAMRKCIRWEGTNRLGEFKDFKETSPYTGEKRTVTRQTGAFGMVPIPDAFIPESVWEEGKRGQKIWREETIKWRKGKAQK